MSKVIDCSHLRNYFGTPYILKINNSNTYLLLDGFSVKSGEEKTLEVYTEFLSKSSLKPDLIYEKLIQEIPNQLRPQSSFGELSSNDFANGYCISSKLKYTTQRELQEILDLFNIKNLVILQQPKRKKLELLLVA